MMDISIFPLNQYQLPPSTQIHLLHFFFKHQKANLEMLKLCFVSQHVSSTPVVMKINCEVMKSKPQWALLYKLLVFNLQFVHFLSLHLQYSKFKLKNHSFFHFQLKNETKKGFLSACGYFKQNVNGICSKSNGTAS